MRESNDDTRNRSTSIRDQLRVDVIWNSAHNDWILCARVLAIDVSPGAWGRLRPLLRKTEPKLAKPGFDARYFGPNFPVKVQRLRDPERQVADLVKFHTFVLDLSPTGASRAVSVPADRPKGLSDWVSYQTFRDFTFQFGRATPRKSSRSEKPSNACANSNNSPGARAPGSPPCDSERGPWFTRLFGERVRMRRPKGEWSRREYCS